MGGFGRRTFKTFFRFQGSGKFIVHFWRQVFCVFVLFTPSAVETAVVLFCFLGKYVCKKGLFGMCDKFALGLSWRFPAIYAYVYLAGSFSANRFIVVSGQ